jgi:GNAT superfamily N-acetyltransferase
MVRAKLVDVEGSRERLHEAMYETLYPSRAEHSEIIDKALVFECFDEFDHIAGWVWFYRLVDEDAVWSIHAMVLPNYRKRFFSQTLVNTLSGVVYALGCDTVRAENDNMDLLVHFGGIQTDEGVDLQLPFFWS